MQDSDVFREGRADQMSKKALMDAVKSDRDRWCEDCCSALQSAYCCLGSLIAGPESKQGQQQVGSKLFWTGVVACQAAVVATCGQYCCSA